jgi:outer membrane receptor for ferrienterochelin and colicin
MSKQTKVRHGLLFVLIGTTLALSSTLTYAQVQTLEVTGSRIRTASAESSSPVTVMTAEDIAASGVTNLQDLLLQMPEMGTPSISRTNSNFSTSSAGVSTIDLRNLGASRTLVLINGRRVVSGCPSSNGLRQMG